MAISKNTKDRYQTMRLIEMKLRRAALVAGAASSPSPSTRRHMREKIAYLTKLIQEKRDVIRSCE